MAPVIVVLFALLCFSGQALSQNEKLTAPPVPAGEIPATTLNLSPDKIEMGTFYNGAPVRIEGTVPSGSQIIVIVRGPAKDELFNKKGHVGPIWVTVDKIHVTGTPSLFLRFSSSDMHTFLDRETIDAYELDELSVKKRMHIRTGKGEPDPQYREQIEKSYLELKKSDGTYRRVANRVETAAAGLSAEHYTLFFHWPRTASPGPYEVEVYACRDRAVVGRAATTLNLVEVGFPELMVTLAHKHPWWYGLLAVVSAMCAGFGIDAVISRLRRPASRRPKPPAPLVTTAEKEIEAHKERVVHH